MSTFGSTFSAYHEGALTMVGERARAAAHQLVEALTSDITVTQSKQVAQMQEMLYRLG